MTVRVTILLAAFIVAIAVLATMEVIVLFKDLYDSEMRDNENDETNYKT